MPETSKMYVILLFCSVDLFFGSDWSVVVQSHLNVPEEQFSIFTDTRIACEWEIIQTQKIRTEKNIAY